MVDVLLLCDMRYVRKTELVFIVSSWTSSFICCFLMNSRNSLVQWLLSGDGCLLVSRDYTDGEVPVMVSSVVATLGVGARPRAGGDDLSGGSDPRIRAFGGSRWTLTGVGQ